MSVAWTGDADGAAHVTATVPLAARQNAAAALSTVTLCEKRAEHNHGSWRANRCLQSDAGTPAARACLHPWPAGAPFRAVSHPEMCPASGCGLGTGQGTWSPYGDHLASRVLPPVQLALCTR